MTTLGVIGLGRIGAFHTETLSGLAGIDELVITDERGDVAEAVAAKHGARYVATVDELLSSGIDGVVVSAATPAHAELTLAAVARGIPTFCEKPIASTAVESARVAEVILASGVPVQVGYQRRYDAAFAAAKRAVDDGSVGIIHTVRSTTMDPAPPPLDYIKGSGGIFRDCAVHDFDIINWITGQRAVEVYATGTVQGDPLFAEYGDVDTAAVIVKFDGGALGVVSNARYNARGYDCRLEIHGFDDSVAAGWDQGVPLRNTDPDNDFPTGPSHGFFMDRFTEAFRTELAAFVEVTKGGPVLGATVADAVEVAWLAEAATESLKRGTPVTIAEVRVASTIKIAGAPISWGVCEVPDWGYQLAPDRVLAEMRGAGLTATELGPEGFLPTDTGELKAVLREKDLACVGGFVPVVLFKEDHDPADDLAGPLESLVAAGAGVVVLAAATGADGYDSRPVLDDAQWARLVANLDRLAAIVAERGLLAVLHPHVGTIVETRADVDRVLQGSSIKLCLDTGHLLIGGTDPLELAKAVPNRIAHTHLKDVDAALAAKVQSGELTYTEAVKAGMYTPLGTGDVDIAGIVSVLRDNGFDGWFVLEQDTILDTEPTGEGPVRDVLASVAYLREVTS